jgi:hypothetical protein
MVDCMAGLEELASATVISVVDEADHAGAKALVSKTIDIKTAVVVIIIFIVVSPILNPELDTLWALNVFAEAGIHESVGKVPWPWGSQDRAGPSAGALVSGRLPEHVGWSTIS